MQPISDTAEIKKAIQDKLVKAPLLTVCVEITDEFGCLPAAQAVAELYNENKIDIWDAFLSINKDASSFWSVDILIQKVIEKIDKLNIDKMIKLCSKLTKLEGDDLAAGRLYDVFERKLGDDRDTIETAFQLSIDANNSHDSIPCITRAFAKVDRHRCAEKLLNILSNNPAEELALQVVYSLQFCKDDLLSTKVQDVLDKYSESKVGLIKRAVYISAKVWKFETICTKLLTEGNSEVLYAAAKELYLGDKIESADELRKQLQYFHTIPLTHKGTLANIDFALKWYYAKFPEECIDFATCYLDKACAEKVDLKTLSDLFPSFYQYLARSLNDEDLIYLEARLLTSNSHAREIFAAQIASQIEFDREIRAIALNDREINLAYLVIKALGWLYGNRRLCLPIIESCLTSMSGSEFENICEIFYDPVCLHFHTEIREWLDTGPNFADVIISDAIKAALKRTKNFYDIFKNNGSCNEIQPSAEMRVAANERSCRRFADAAKRSQEQVLLGFLTSNKVIALLHGGKMICYDNGENGKMSRQVCPMQHSSITWKTPKLMVLNGSNLNDRLLEFRLARFLA